MRRLSAPLVLSVTVSVSVSVVAPLILVKVYSPLIIFADLGLLDSVWAATTASLSKMPLVEKQRSIPSVTVFNKTNSLFVYLI